MPEGPLSVEVMADDAAEVLRALDIGSAHVAGFSGGSIFCPGAGAPAPRARSQPRPTEHLAGDGRLPAPVALLRPWPVEVAPSERAFLEWFFLDIYTARAHNDGTVDQFIEEVLAFPHKQSTEDVQRFLDAFFDHDTSDRLPEIAVPTLVLAGGRDSTARPPLGRAVAELIPGAQFEVLEEEAHQPFQEVPDEWNARVEAFWREVEDEVDPARLLSAGAAPVASARGVQGEQGFVPSRVPPRGGP